MSSRQNRGGRLTQHLKQSATVQLSLISMQVDELITGVQHYHRKIESKAARVLVGDNTEKLNALIDVLKKRLQIIGSLNLSFYELLDSEDNDNSSDSDTQEEAADGQAESVLGPPAIAEEQTLESAETALQAESQATLRPSQAQPALLPQLFSSSTSTGGGGCPPSSDQENLEQAVQLPVEEALWLGHTPALTSQLGHTPAPTSQLGHRPALTNQLGHTPALTSQLGHTPTSTSQLDLNAAISSLLFAQWNVLRSSSRGSTVGPTLTPLAGYPGTNLISSASVPFFGQPDLSSRMPASLPEFVPGTLSSTDTSLNLQLPQPVSTVAQPSFPAVESRGLYLPSVMPRLFDRPGPSLGTPMLCDPLCVPPIAAALPQISPMIGALPGLPAWIGEVPDVPTSIGEVPATSDCGAQARLTVPLGELASPCSLSPVASADATVCRKILAEDTLCTDSAIFVMVTYCNNPSDFYVVKDSTNVELLTNQISIHVEQCQELELETPFVGMLCLAKYSDGVCYRARIIHIHHDDFLSVYFVDFGNTYRTLRSEILVLGDQFCHLPALAIHCCLREVMPSSKSGQWTERAVREFERFAMGRPMVLKATVPPRPGSDLPYIVDLLGPTPVPIAGNGHEITNIPVTAILLNLKEAAYVDNEELLACWETLASPETQLEGSLSSGSTSYHTVSSATPSTTSPSATPTATSPSQLSSVQHDRYESCVEDACDKIGTIPCPAEKISDRGKKGHAVRRQLLGPGLHQFANVMNVVGSTASEHPKCSPSLPKVSTFFVEPSGSVCKATSGGADEDKEEGAGQKTDSSDPQALPRDGSDRHQSKPGMVKVVRRLILAKEGSAHQQLELQKTERGASIDTGSAQQQELQKTEREASIETGSAQQQELQKAEREQQQLQQVREEPEEVMDEKAIFKTLMQMMDGGGDVSAFKAMVQTIHSPSDFHVHIVSEKTGTNLLNLEADLLRHFQRMSDRDLQAHSKRLRAGPGVLCAAQFRKGAHYYRGLIVGTRQMQQLNQDCDGAVHDTLEVHIFYIDYGDKEWLPQSLVYPLPSDFHCMAPQALWCSLAFVLPLGEASAQKQIAASSPEDSTTAVWDDRARAEFERMLRGCDNQRVLQIYAANYQTAQGKRAAEVQKYPLQIVVMIEEEGQRICVNHDLIVRDFASFTALSNNDDCRQEDGEDDPKKWLDMELDAQSLRNTYAVDVNDAGVALTGVKARGGQEGICRFYNSPSGCWRGDKCHYLHGMEKNVSDNLKQVLVFDENQEEILPLEGSVVHVEVSCVINPQLFYVVLPWGPHSAQAVKTRTLDVESFLSRETLESLNKAMETFYKNRRLDTDYSVFAISQAVAAKCPETGLWLRAKVVDVNPDDEEVCVMFVDLGDTEWVPETAVRLLDERFLHLPPQAVECGLSGVAAPCGSEVWPDTSTLDFHSLVNGKTLLAHVQERLWSGRLLLKLYDTSGDEDLDIGTTLIGRGCCAAAASDSRCRGSPRSPDRTESPCGRAKGLYVPA